MTAGEFIRMIQDRRRYHLRRLVEQFGSQHELAEKARMKQSQISSILAGQMAMSEMRARRN